LNTLWENIFKKQAQQRSLTRILSDNILFQDLSTKELSLVEEIVHERHYRKGEFIFQQGEVGVGMYIIAQGSVDITLYDNQPLVPDGSKHVLVTRLEAGDFFGELSLVEDGGRRSASSIAAEDCILIGFFKPDLLEILERSPTVGIKIVFRLAEVLGRRLKETTDKIRVLRRELGHIQNKSTDPL